MVWSVWLSSVLCLLSFFFWRLAPDKPVSAALPDLLALPDPPERPGLLDLLVPLALPALPERPEPPG